MSDRLTENWVKTRSVPRLEGVSTHAANFISERDSPRHVHQQYVFGLAMAGAMELDCGHCNETHILEPDDLMLTGAQGAKNVILAHSARLTEIPAPAAAFDVDTLADYERLVRNC